VQVNAFGIICAPDAIVAAPAVSRAFHVIAASTARWGPLSSVGFASRSVDHLSVSRRSATRKIPSPLYVAVIK
jgi:hypothetical protein